MARYSLVSFTVLFFALSCCSSAVIPRNETDTRTHIAEGIRASLEKVDDGRHLLERHPEQPHERLKPEPSLLRLTVNTPQNTDNKEDLDTTAVQGPGDVATRDIVQTLPRPWWNTPAKHGHARKRKGGKSRGRPRAPDDSDDNDECSESSSSEEESSEIIFGNSPGARKKWSRPRRWRRSWGRAGGGTSFGRDEADSERRGRNRRRPSKRCRKNRRVVSQPTTVTPFVLVTTAKLPTTATVATLQPHTTTHAVQTTQTVRFTNSKTESPTTRPTTEGSTNTEETSELPTTTHELTTTEVKTLGIDPEPK